MTVLGMEMGSVIGEKIDPFVFIIYDENSILITFLIKIHSLLPLIW